MASNKFIKNFVQFINEQEVPPIADPTLGATPDLGMGATPTDTEPAPSKMKFIFIEVNRDGSPINTNIIKTYQSYEDTYDNIDEWTKQHVPSSKQEDFMQIFKFIEDKDTLEEKQLINKFKDAVEAGDIATKSSFAEIDFDSNGEAYADDLDINYIFYTKL